MINNKHYHWLDVEKYVLNKVDENNYYADANLDEPSYTTIMPPPNVTGYLHMGHALVTTLQDILVRYKRMKSYNVLWQPGIDHAGIATQFIVEKQLLAQGIKKEDLGRDKFLDKVYEWKDHSRDRIIEQIKRLGASADFSYLAFTMDDQSSKGVKEAFIRLYNEGLIYKDNRLVNWDCSLQTAISDLEVENKSAKGKLYYLKYYIENSSNYISVATTRPETLFGDVAIAVNGQDERYKDIVGEYVIIPLVGRKIKVIADPYADIEKGSGAVKITPAHDFNDFDVGKRHGLDSINILNKDGTLNSNVLSSYQGKHIHHVRSSIVSDLESTNLIDKIEDYITTTPYGDRSNSIIEPFLTQQWFINTSVLAKEAIDVVKEKKIEFTPKSWSNLYFDWMNNIQPWCISRQLWWGHRIPAYYAVGEHTNGEIFVASSIEEASKKARDHFGFNVDLMQDEDVLDTWFSSSLWPFLTLGWPDNTKKIQKYFPTDILVTGFDIIFFWVARMIMMSLFFTKQVPFKKVYIHALIRDDKGQKMSKSKGNVIDPLDVIEKYGTDALRFSLANYSAHGNDIKMSEKTIEGYRNFITKIWNSYKFCNQNGLLYNPNYDVSKVSLSINKWILFKLSDLEQNIESHYNNLKFNEITNNLYHFIWSNFCDWYIEITKPILYSKDSNEEDKVEILETMGFVFDSILKISHPVIPYISQYLFEQLHQDSSKILCKEKMPNNNFNISKESIQEIDSVISFISKIRSLRSSLNIPPSVLLDLFVEGNILPDYLFLNIEIVKKLSRLNSLSTQDVLPKNYVKDMIDNYTVGFFIGEIIDVNVEINRISKSIHKLNVDLDKINSKLNNNQFLNKASPDVVNDFREKHDEISSKILNLSSLLSKIKLTLES